MFDKYLALEAKEAAHEKLNITAPLAAVRAHRRCVGGDCLAIQPRVG